MSDDPTEDAAFLAGYAAAASDIAMALYIVLDGAPAKTAIGEVLMCEHWAELSGHLLEVEQLREERMTLGAAMRDIKREERQA